VRVESEIDRFAAPRHSSNRTIIDAAPCSPSPSTLSPAYRGEGLMPQKSVPPAFVARRCLPIIVVPGGGGAGLRVRAGGRPAPPGAGPVGGIWAASSIHTTARFR
jgi:hypothetical protein